MFYFYFKQVTRQYVTDLEEQYIALKKSLKCLSMIGDGDQTC